MKAIYAWAIVFFILACGSGGWVWVISFFIGIGTYILLYAYLGSIEFEEKRILWRLRRDKKRKKYSESDFYEINKSEFKKGDYVIIKQKGKPELYFEKIVDIHYGEGGTGYTSENEYLWTDFISSVLSLNVYGYARKRD